MSKLEARRWEGKTDEEQAADQAILDRGMIPSGSAPWHYQFQFNALVERIEKLERQIKLCLPLDKSDDI